MLTLHLGVLDVGYGDASGAKTAKVSVETTGDVAEILEEKYHIFEIFFELHGQEIADRLTQSMADHLFDVGGGAPVLDNPLQGAEQEIETSFREFLTMRAMDSLGYPGIPTMAAEKGISHRFLHPYAKDNPPRPSFVDTGLYEASFRIWVD